MRAAGPELAGQRAGRFHHVGILARKVVHQRFVESRIVFFLVAIEISDRAVHFRSWNLEDASRVPERRSESEGVEGRHVRHVIFAPQFGDVFLDFLAPCVFEIDVDVWVVRAVRADESLETQTETDRIDVCDAEKVSYERSRT